MIDTTVMNEDELEEIETALKNYYEGSPDRDTSTPLIKLLTISTIERLLLTIRSRQSDIVSEKQKLERYADSVDEFFEDGYR